MTDAPLERRCRRVARAYPDELRAAEVATTLMESNEGRPRPRAADAADVLWHGLRARLRSRGAAPARFGVWGDAVAVGVVQAVVMQAAVALALASRAFARPVDEYAGYPALRAAYARHPRPLFFSREEGYAAVLAALVAAAAAVAACSGRVRAARAAVLLAALGGVGAVVVARLAGHGLTFSSRGALGVAATGALVAAAVAGTRAVARAAGAAPRWWWAVAGVACVATAFVVLQLEPVVEEPRLGSGGRVTAVWAAYITQAWVVLALSVLLRGQAALTGGAAVVALPATAAFLLMVEDGFTSPRAAALSEATVVAVGVALLVAVATVTRAHLRARRG